MIFVDGIKGLIVKEGINKNGEGYDENEGIRNSRRIKYKRVVLWIEMITEVKIENFIRKRCEWIKYSLVFEQTESVK